MMVEGFGQESGLEMSEFSAYLRVLADISAYLRVLGKMGRGEKCPIPNDQASAFARDATARQAKEAPKTINHVLGRDFYAQVIE